MNIRPGRYRAELPHDFAVFLIGARINKLWAIHRWLPFMGFMPRMLSSLLSKPESGLLHVETMFYWRGIMVLQYWRSKEDIWKFASNPNEVHLDAWKSFAKKFGKSEAIGIWHETYEVKQGTYENVYGNMPPFGLGAFAKAEKVGGY
jgi:hypothetical protein